VPWLPPRSFEEAVQSLWFTQNAAIISYGAGSGITPGRVDQLLYPYFVDDLARGVLTREHALRLLEELVIKLNNNVVIWPNIGGVKLNHLGSDVENITLGGVDAQGNDATNELSYLFIEAVTNTNLATTASFRVSEKSPKDFVRQVVAIHRQTNSPAFLNDETTIAAMVRDGYTLEAAREYCLVGCVEPSGNGDSYGAMGGSKIYFPTRRWHRGPRRARGECAVSHATFARRQRRREEPRPGGRLPRRARRKGAAASALSLPLPRQVHSAGNGGAHAGPRTALPGRAAGDRGPVLQPSHRGRRRRLTRSRRTSSRRRD
jgi:hypothetical protein